MDAKNIIREIRQYCKDNANAENIIKSQRFFKEAPELYGLTQVQLNSKAKDMLRQKSFSLETVIEAAPVLLRSGMYEEVTMTLLLVDGFEKQYTRELLTEISHWFSFSIHNWAHADTLGMFILPKFLKYKLATEADFESWIVSSYKFQRRCVPVTFIKILKTRENFQYLFDFLKPLMKDNEREVHQGMGWFLRECWKIKPEETEDFLLTWKDKAPRLIIQYSTEKMSAEEKLRFKRSK